MLVNARNRPRKNRSNRPQPRRGPSNRRDGQSNIPKPFNPVASFTRCFRFQAAAPSLSSVPQAIPGNNLFFMQLLATSSIASCSLIQAFRIVKIRAWSPPGATLPISLQWYANTTTTVGVRPTIRLDVNLGSTFLAKASLKPTPGTDSAAWQNQISTGVTTTGGDFLILAPQGTLLDIIVECYLVNSTMVQVGPVSAGNLTAGFPYNPYLDWNSANPLIWAPISPTPFKP